MARPLHFLTLGLISLIIVSCNDTKPVSRTLQTTDTTASTAVPAVPTSTAYPEVKTWIDDFKNFRNAVNDGDTEKLKTYFVFPLDAESTQIWSAIFEQESELKNKQAITSFTEKDFEQYRTRIFNAAFVKSLLKIKSAKLAEKGSNESPEFNDKGESFSMLVEYNKETKSVFISLGYAGGIDENGEYVSEGEHSTIFEFDVIDQKYLRFNRVMFAG